MKEKVHNNVKYIIMKEPENKIENILNSLDGISRAKARPFMYTRVMARMQNEEKNIWSQIGNFIARPVIALSCLLIILGTNIYFVMNGENRQDETTVATVTDVAADDSYTVALNNNNYILSNFEQ